MLTRQLPALEVERIAVAVVRWQPEYAHAAVVLQPSQLPVVGMSLQTRYRPCAFQAGPSDQSAPVHSLWIGALGCARPLKLGSTAMTSGSQKYVLGAPFGPKSRGGVVTV